MKGLLMYTYMKVDKITTSGCNISSVDFVGWLDNSSFGAQRQPYFSWRSDTARSGNHKQQKSVHTYSDTKM